MISAKTFADFFGVIDFSNRDLTGDNIGADDGTEAQDIAHLRNKAAIFKREIDKTAKALAMIGRDNLTATHNRQAESMAAELAKEWAMRRCNKCQRYRFENDGPCLHEGCK